MSVGKISTLICAHSPSADYDAMLAMALASLRYQSRKPDQIVVVLDECWQGSPACPEPTKAMVESILTQKGSMSSMIFSREKKQGLASAKNFGLKHCSGDWITYLDADDEWLPCKLKVQEQTVFNILETGGKVDACFTQAWDSYDGYHTPNCFHPGQYRTHNDIEKRIFQENVLCHGSAMIRRSLYDQVVAQEGHFYSEDRRYLGREDWELWQRLIMMYGARFYNIPERLYVYSMGTSVER